MNFLRPISLLGFLLAFGGGCASLIGADFDRPGGEGGDASSTTASSGGGSGACTDCPDPGPCEVSSCDPTTHACVIKAGHDGDDCTAKGVAGVCSSGICGGPCANPSDCDAKDCLIATCASKNCHYAPESSFAGTTCGDGMSYCNDAGVCGDHCVDGVKDVQETGTDCGGACNPCAYHLPCNVNADCQSNYCDAGTCASWATSLSALGARACVVTNAKKVKCWGNNDQGQLGDNSHGQPSHLPVNAGTLANVSAVEVGNVDACAVDTQALYGWGQNESGEIDGQIGVERDAPVVVQSLSSGVAFGSLGYRTGCALLSSGSVKCWCEEASGACGNGTDISRTPVTVPGLTNVAEVHSRNLFNCARTTDGAVKCWGANASGVLGDGSLNHGQCEGSYDCSGTPVTANVTHAKTLSVSLGSVCVSTDTHQIWCWGASGHDWLDDANSTTCFLGTCNPVPTQVSGITDAVKVAVGGSFACALSTSGKVTCWGQNNSGNLGDGTTNASTTPVEVQGLYGAAIDIAAGNGFACAINAAGGIQCWGANDQGQLGDGSVVAQSATPVRVVLQ